jgi:Zn-dependent M28 family amino/carboxypeptidase
LALLAIAFALIAGTDWSEAGHRWWAHVRFLASDELAGREAGSPGFDRAAEYVARQFQRAGLQPGGDHGYFQPVQFTRLTLEEPASSLALVANGGTITARLGEDAILGLSPESAAHIEAPLVFVGYGLKIPEANWDDLNGGQLKGAVAVYLKGGPSRIPGNLRSHYSSSQERWKALKAAGAIGSVALTNPKDMEVPWSRISASRLMPRMVLADPAMNETSGVQFSAAWNPDQSEMLFKGSGHTFSSLLDAVNDNRPLPHFVLPWKVRANTASRREPVSSKNIIGVRWGSDPQLTHEFVVLSAHLDHLGLAPKGENDRVYNGAMDDAAGIASLIEIANELQRAGTKTDRSIVFLAVTAEEKGELGSNYYARRPSLPGQYVSDINMDMFLPLFPLKYLEVQGLTESSLGDDIRAVCEKAGVEVQADKEPNKNRFIRSDQYSFIKQGVPALAFKFGYIPGTPEEKLFQSWYRERYHGVTDDISQPVDTAAAAQFNTILAKLAQRIANAPRAPAWKQDSFFKRFAAPGHS